MKIVSTIDDKRIKSKNFLIELTIGEYLEFAPNIIENNKFQRKRLKSASKIYSNLKKDIEVGCVIPPIVLALTNENREIDNNNVQNILNENKDSLMILDGLQRTYTFIDLNRELQDKTRYYSSPIRVELYVGINRLGVLYRMLTLNTGQTPMSLRHQIEMLYSNFSADDLDGIELLKEVDTKRAYNDNQYNFKDILDGFNSYVERNELPISRDDILDNIQSLEKLAIENNSEDLFKYFLKSWDAVIKKFRELTNAFEVTVDNCDPTVLKFEDYFGKNSNQVFKKSQGITGFGAAIGKLKDFDIINSLSEIEAIIDQIFIDTDGRDFIENINAKLNYLKSNSSKIGNAQRLFFQYYFRDLFNRENDSYLNASKAIDSAIHKYNSQIS